MKKPTVFLFILICITTSISFAQSASISRSKSQTAFKELNFSSEEPDPAFGSGPILLNNINIKAVRDFMKTYEDPSDIRWTILTNGYRVHFISDGIQHRIFYDRQGDRDYMMRHYDEDRMPSDIRYMVKSKYNDYSIHDVSEIIKGDRKIYLVKIESKTCWKTILIADDEMVVKEELFKN